MTKILFCKEKKFNSEFIKLLKKRDDDDRKIDKTVESIIENVKKKSDQALIDLTKKFDKFSVKKVSDLVVSQVEIEKSFKSISSKVLSSLRNAIIRVKAYHRKQLPKNNFYKDKKGVLLGGIWNPIDSVGLYVPGGKAAYPSSLIMNAVPAIVAGVKRIVVTVPVTKGEVNPLVLACLKILGIKEIYKIGGAQAIAALAYGTKTIRKVDKIFGPGNAYVASAKKKSIWKSRYRYDCWTFRNISSCR